MKKVVVTDYTFHELSSEQAAAESNQAEFLCFQCKNEQEMIAAARGADVLVVQFAPVTRPVIDALAPSATIIRYGVGYDNIDVRYAAEKGRKVCYIPDYCMHEVADHAVALLLANLRRLRDMDTSVRRGEWQGVKIAGSMKSFDATTIGFIGLGRIGRAALTRLKPFGFRFSAFDPALTDGQAMELGVAKGSLDSVFETADAIMLHLPLTAATKHIINDRSLSRMKAGAVIVNCSRGDLIHEESLANALHQGKVSAGLDVFSTEPLAMDNPLFDAPNCILSPHIAWYSKSAISNLQNLAAEEIKRALLSQSPRCPVPELSAA